MSMLPQSLPGDAAGTTEPHWVNGAGRGCPGRESYAVKANSADHAEA